MWSEAAGAGCLGTGQKKYCKNTKFFLANNGLQINILKAGMCFLKGGARIFFQFGFGG